MLLSKSSKTKGGAGSGEGKGQEHPKGGKRDQKIDGSDHTGKSKKGVKAIKNKTVKEKKK